MSLIIPNTFADKSGSIQLSLLDENFTEVSNYLSATVIPITLGGTGQITRQAAMDALAGATTSGLYLRGNGTDVVMSAIQTADIPNATLGNWFSGVAKVAGDGVMEVGRYIDFHSTNAGTSDYDVRLDCSGANAISFGGSTVTANTFSGTLSGQGNSTLASGATLSSTNVGSIRAPGMVIQTVYLRTDALTTYTIPTPGVSPFAGVYISDQSTTITPKYSNSAIFIQWNPTFECINDVVFRLFRSVSGVDTEIGRNAVAAAGAWVGWAMPGYDADNSTTARTNHHIYLDFPATTAAVTYKFMITLSTTGSGAQTFYQNRPIRSAGASIDEIGISQVILQEIAQ